MTDAPQFPPVEFPLENSAQIPVSAFFGPDHRCFQGAFREERLAGPVCSSKDPDRGRRVDAFGPDDGKEEVIESPLESGDQTASFDHMSEGVGLRMWIVDQASQQLVGEGKK